MKTVYYIFRRLCLGVEPYTPSRAFFDGDEDLVALLHDCIPLLSKIQFFLLCHCSAGAVSQTVTSQSWLSCPLDVV